MSLVSGICRLSCFNLGDAEQVALSSRASVGSSVKWVIGSCLVLMRMKQQKARISAGVNGCVMPFALPTGALFISTGRFRDLWDWHGVRRGCIEKEKVQEQVVFLLVFLTLYGDVCP